MSINWERMVARWDRWYETTLAQVRADAAAGDDKAIRVLARYEVLRRTLPKRTALNRALVQTR